MPRLDSLHRVTLVAGDGSPDPLTPWIDVFNNSSVNATTLLNNFGIAPGVALQQMIANQAGYLQDFFNDPTSNSVTAIMGQIQDNLAAVITGYTLQGASSATVTSVTEHTLDGGGLGHGHTFLFQEVPSFLPASVPASEVTPILDFLASPASGIIMGELGPAISPWIALMNSINDGDDFNTTLANMVNGYFNGADLSLNSLIPTIEQAGIFPAGMNLENLDIAFGGLLTPGTVAVGPYVSDGTHIPAVGGSIFNSLGITLTGVPILGQIDATSHAIGPIAAMGAWGQTIGALLGSGWDGKSTPVEVSPPLTGVTLPTIPTDFLDDGGAGSSAATDLSTLFQDVASWF